MTSVQPLQKWKIAFSFKNVCFLSLILKSPFLNLLWGGICRERMWHHLEESSPLSFLHTLRERDWEQTSQFLGNWKHVMIKFLPLGQSFSSLSWGHVSWKGLVEQTMLSCGLNTIFSPQRNAPCFAAGSTSKAFTLRLLHVINIEGVILELDPGGWKTDTAGRSWGREEAWAAPHWETPKSHHAGLRERGWGLAAWAGPRIEMPECPADTLWQMWLQHPGKSNAI